MPTTFKDSHSLLRAFSEDCRQVTNKKEILVGTGCGPDPRAEYVFCALGNDRESYTIDMTDVVASEEPWLDEKPNHTLKTPNGRAEVQTALRNGALWK